MANVTRQTALGTAIRAREKDFPFVVVIAAGAET